MKFFGSSARGCFPSPQLDDQPLQNFSSHSRFLHTETSKESPTKNTGKSSSIAHRVHDHVKMGPKLSETVKSKLSLGARIIQEGGRGNIFKSVFGMQEKEQLLKASQCYLFTTAGPVAGILFVSTEKVAFYSERPIKFTSVDGELIRVPYKVLIPIGSIKEVHECQDVNKVEQKYIEIVTKDDSEFWFVGFVRYDKALKNLKKAISMSNQF
ncbi:hypothetical protein Fmac_015592 [Flemingia macrophylla]|uniref:GRAM domain-containing protein n=1 Tax=Flemingia macrophylla TaxID=520843 RepID=A0ABD1MEZ3_9FABA